MNDNNDVPALIVGILILIAGILGGCISSDCWRSEIIKHGYAQHNPTTGAWEWKDNK